MAQLFANNAKSTLVSSISNSAVELELNDASAFPSPGSDFYVATLIEYVDASTEKIEIVRVTGKSSNTLTVTRAQEGTAAQEFSAGARVEMRLTKGSMDGLAQVANNLSDLPSASTARTNLGLGTAAVEADTKYTHRANNLSDVANVSTARDNLGLGTAATKNTGTSGDAVPLLNGTNTWSAKQYFTVSPIRFTSSTGAYSTPDKPWGIYYAVLHGRAGGGPVLAGSQNVYITVGCYKTNTSTKWLHTGTVNAAGQLVLGQGNLTLYASTSAQTEDADVTNFKVRFRVDANGTSGGVDNTYSCGTSAYRWTTVYAASGAINTSDARDKTPIQAFSDAELAAAKALGAEIGTYKFLSSVESKGQGARTHIGLTVQRAIEIMEAHGLDPFKYGFICYDEWEDKYDEELNEEGEIERDGLRYTQKLVCPAGNRYSFRYDELNQFILRGIVARLDALEALI